MGLPAEIPFNELYRAEGSDDAVQRIGETLQGTGFDAVPELYDQALGLARDGHLGRARDTLQMLLCLDPDDGPAHLLLGKVYASQRRWDRAASSLDAAAACGQRLPPGMKDAFEQERAAANRPAEPRTATRRDSEVHALREEARRLRSDSMHARRVAEAYQTRSQLLTAATAVLGGIALILVGVMIFGGGPEAQALEVEELSSGLSIDQLEAQAPTATVVAPVLVAEPTREALPVEELPSVTVASTELSEPVVDTVVEPVAPSETIWTVESGDTMWTIAKAHYGDAMRWKDIAAANDLPEHAGLSLGQQLVLPE